MQTLIAILLGTYIIIGIRLFISWMKFYSQDTELSSGWSIASIVIISLASVLWVIVVPFAYLELLNKVQTTKAKAQINAELADSESKHDQPSLH